MIQRLPLVLATRLVYYYFPTSVDCRMRGGIGCRAFG